MTEKQKSYKNSLIQKIQINKKNVFSNDEQRISFIQSRFNCSSTKDMSIDQLNMLLDFCLRKVSDIPLVEMVTGSQLLRIKTLWESKAKDKSEDALIKFIFRISKRDSFLTLTKSEATKVIIALNKMH